jgi:hypothetical protein
LRRVVCNGDAEAAGEVKENYPLAFVAYYPMFHKRNVDAAERVLDLLKSRSLDEKSKAALEILEMAREAVKNLPCRDPKALRQYVEKINGIQTYGWASVFKALVLAHLTDDEDYKDDVRLAILWTAEKRQCDSTSVCYFAYYILNKVKPLCPN